MDLRNTEGRERFNVVELPIDAEKKEGTKLQQRRLQNHYR